MHTGNTANQGPDSVSGQADKTGAVRILDAEANRAAEGLRVVEDYVRFVLDDHNLTSLVKALRHDLTAALRPVATLDRLAARESQSDVGATLATAAEGRRIDARDVAAASLKRVQQALRGLEEYAKPVDPAVASAVEPLRYRSYTLERAIGITADSLARLREVRLYVLLDGRQDEDEFARVAGLLVEAGIDAVQLREKRLTDRELVARARRLRQITRGSATLFIMNDRADLAALVDADGVHVGQEELNVKDARAIVGPRALVGVSTHSVEQARQAVVDGANYIGVGPTFPSDTKKFDSFTGIELIRMIAGEIRLPAFAIGGITIENVTQVVAAGLNRVAIGGAILNARDPAAAVRRFKELLARN